MTIVITPQTTADEIEQLRAYVGDEPVDDALARMRRIVPCDECAGDGVIERMPTSLHDMQTERTCLACDGTGEMEIDVEPITIDDL